MFDENTLSDLDLLRLRKLGLSITIIGFIFLFISYTQSEQNQVESQQVSGASQESPSVLNLSAIAATVILIGLSISTYTSVLKVRKDRQEIEAGRPVESLIFDSYTAIGLLTIWTGRLLLTAIALQRSSRT